MTIAKLNESALLAAGLPKDVVEALRHILTQAGKVKGATTLPELASNTDGLTPIVNGLTITVTATNQAVANIEASQGDLQRSDAHLVRRLDDLEAAAERVSGEYAALAKAVAALRDEMGEPVSISGINTGDQTLASLGAAAVAGSSSQPFATSALSSVGAVQSGTTGTAGMLKIARASDGAYVGTDTMNLNVREITNQAGDIVHIQGATERLRVTGVGITVNGALTTAGGVLHATNTALNNGANVSAGTLNNAPIAGNPTKWVQINDNGTTRWIPAW